MNAGVSPFLSLSALIGLLRGSIGGWGLRGWLSTALVLLLYRRLGEIARRMDGLAGRFVAGTVRRRGADAPVAAEGSGRVRQAVAERIWPGDFGWLVKAARWHAAGFGSQLRTVLAEPEMVALLAACPQAVRVLRPLCRMLAVETSLLRPAVTRPEAGTVAVAAPKRVRVPRPKPDLGRVPIPRGVMSAVRRGRFAAG